MSAMKKIYIFITIAFCTQLNASDYLPQSIEETHLFELCGDFTLRYGFVIKVAEIGWYAPDCEAESSVLTAKTKLLRFHYFKEVSADFFKESAAEYFLMNLDSKEQQLSLTNDLNLFNDAYKDIKPGEYYDLILSNDQQISLHKNNQLLGRSDNAVFAEKYFNIWFGEIPVIQKLKAAFIN